MARKKDKLEGYAEHLYINEGWTQKAIAEYLGVTEKTVGSWKSGGNWDYLRQTALAAPHRIKTILLTEFEKLATGKESKIDADAISKISKAIEALSDKVSVQVVTSVFKEFDTWMLEHDPALAMKFTEYHRKFIMHKINIDG